MSDQPVRVISREEALRIVRQQQQQQGHQQQQSQHRQQQQPPQQQQQRERHYQQQNTQPPGRSSGAREADSVSKLADGGSGWCQDSSAPAADDDAHDYEEEDDFEDDGEDDGEMYFDGNSVQRLERGSGVMDHGDMRNTEHVKRLENRQSTSERHHSPSVQHGTANPVTAQRLRLPHGISITPEVASASAFGRPPTNIPAASTSSGKGLALADRGVTPGSRAITTLGTRLLDKSGGTVCSDARVQKIVRESTTGVKLPRGITATLVEDQGHASARSISSTPEAVMQKDGEQFGDLVDSQRMYMDGVAPSSDEFLSPGGATSYDPMTNDDLYNDDDDEYHDDGDDGVVSGVDGDHFIDDVSDVETKSGYYMNKSSSKYTEQETRAPQLAHGVTTDTRSVKELSSERLTGSSRSEVPVSTSEVPVVAANTGQSVVNRGDTRSIALNKPAGTSRSDREVSTSHPQMQHIRLPPGVTLTSTGPDPGVQRGPLSTTPARSADTRSRQLLGGNVSAPFRLPQGVSVSCNDSTRKPMEFSGINEVASDGSRTHDVGCAMSGSATLIGTAGGSQCSDEFAQQQAGEINDPEGYGDEVYSNGDEQDCERENEENVDFSDVEVYAGEESHVVDEDEYRDDEYGNDFSGQGEFYVDTCNTGEKVEFGDETGAFNNGEEYEGGEYYADNQEEYEGAECESSEQFESNSTRGRFDNRSGSMAANDVGDSKKVTEVELRSGAKCDRSSDARTLSACSSDPPSIAPHVAAHSQSLYENYNLPSGIKLYSTVPRSRDKASDMNEQAFEDEHEQGMDGGESGESVDEDSDGSERLSRGSYIPPGVSLTAIKPSAQRDSAAGSSANPTQPLSARFARSLITQHSSAPSNEHMVKDTSQSVSKQPIGRTPTVASAETLQQLGFKLPKGISIQRQIGGTKAVAERMEGDREMSWSSHSAMSGCSGSADDTKLFRNPSAHVANDRGRTVESTCRSSDNVDVQNVNGCSTSVGSSGLTGTSGYKESDDTPTDTTAASKPAQHVSQSDIGTFRKLIRPGPRSARLAQLAKLPPDVASSLMKAAASGDSSHELPSDGLFESTEVDDPSGSDSASGGDSTVDDDGFDEGAGDYGSSWLPDQSGKASPDAAQVSTRSISDESSARVVSERLHNSSSNARLEPGGSVVSKSKTLVGAREVGGAKSLTLQEARALCRQNAERCSARTLQSNDSVRVPALKTAALPSSANVLNSNIAHGEPESLSKPLVADDNCIDEPPGEAASVTSAVSSPVGVANLAIADSRADTANAQPDQALLTESAYMCQPDTSVISASADSRDGGCSIASRLWPKQSDRQRDQLQQEELQPLSTVVDGSYGEEDEYGLEVEEEAEMAMDGGEETEATMEREEEAEMALEGGEEVEAAMDECREAEAPMDGGEEDGYAYSDQLVSMEAADSEVSVDRAQNQAIASVTDELPAELSSIIGELHQAPLAEVVTSDSGATTALADAHSLDGTAEDLSEVKDMLDMLDEKPELLVGGQCGQGDDMGGECAPLMSQECDGDAMQESTSLKEVEEGVVSGEGDPASGESSGEERQEQNDGDESEQDAPDLATSSGRNRRRKRRKHRQKKGKDSESASGSVADRAEAGTDQHNSDDEDTPKNKRRNIRKILSEQKLDAETLRAQEEEKERQQRLADQKRWFEQFRRDQERAKRQLEGEQWTAVKQEMLLPSDLEELAVDAGADDTIGVANDSDAVVASARPSDVITLSSDEDSGHALQKTVTPDSAAAVPDPDISHQLSQPPAAAAAETSDDDIQLLSSTEEESTAPDDVNNSGAHTDDTCNVPDAQGRVLINVGHPPSEEDIFLAPQVARNIKSHQIGGVRFLYDNLIESQERCKNTPGFGCILAHSMGLGKTMQTVTFSDIFLRNTTHRLVLIIVPINTIQNWVNEFNYWIPPEGCYSPLAEYGELRHRTFSVFVLGENHRTMQARSKVIQEWSNEGGVMLMGYEMYRLLSVSSASRKKKKRPAADDAYAEEREKLLLENIKSALCKPGPDLVICDEGHRIKNAGASISLALKSIRTRRRLALTGYPLQNNLVEYWCMVDFVRPNFLGTKAEFNNMFERPICNGQCADSTQSDVRLMRFRAHVLHSLLEGLVQRRSQAILEAALPKKEEYVCLLRMSPLQRSLYKRFITDLLQRSGHTPNPLRAFIVSCKIWNHPDILYNLVRRKFVDEDLDLDDSAATNPTTTNASAGGTPKRGAARPPVTPAPPALGAPIDGAVSAAVDSENPPSSAGGSAGVAATGQLMAPEAGGEALAGDVKPPTPAAAAAAPREDFISYDWAQEMLQNYTAGLLENSTKMQVFSAILDESVRLGDKMLLFSQSLFTLNIIEEFLQQRLVPGREERWTPNVNYYRLDGSTGGLERERLIHEFNNSEAVPLFLVSTRAGSLGVNLVGANRVLVFDASWNPCHDTQAVCRVYRFGQQKKCYIYRLVTDNSMERRIYDRQVKKQSMSNRIVDETNPENMLVPMCVHGLDSLQVGANTLNRLLDPDEDDPAEDAVQIDGSCYSDPVLRRVIERHARLFTKEPFEHDKQLVDRRDKRLTQAEKRLAKRSYELEKRASASGLARPGARHVMGTMGMYRGMYTKPVANVRPMMTTGRGGGAAGSGMTATASTLGTHRYSAEQLARQGVTMTHITVPKDVSIPTGTGEGEPIMLRRGQMVLVIKTAKGVYLRLQDGRIIAIRMPQGSANASNGVPDFLSGGVTTPAPSARQPPTLGRLRAMGAPKTVTMSSTAGGGGTSRADGVIRLPRSITVERVPSTESGEVPGCRLPPAVMAVRGRGVAARVGGARGIKRMVVPSRAAAAAVAAMAGDSRTLVASRSAGGTMLRRQQAHGPLGSVSLVSSTPSPGRVKVLVKPDSAPVVSRVDDTPIVTTSASPAKDETNTVQSKAQSSPTSSSADQSASLSIASTPTDDHVSDSGTTTTPTAATAAPLPASCSPSVVSSSSSMSSLPVSVGTVVSSSAGGSVEVSNDNTVSPLYGSGNRADNRFNVSSMMVDSTLSSPLNRPVSLPSTNSPPNFMPSTSPDLTIQQQQHHQFYNQPPQFPPVSAVNTAANSFADSSWQLPSASVSSRQTGVSAAVSSAGNHRHPDLSDLSGMPPHHSNSGALSNRHQYQQQQPGLMQHHASTSYPTTGSVGLSRAPSMEMSAPLAAGNDWGQLAASYQAPSGESSWLPASASAMSAAQGPGPWKTHGAPGSTISSVASDSTRRRQHKPRQQQQQQAERHRFSQQQHYQDQPGRHVMAPPADAAFGVGVSGGGMAPGSNPGLYAIQQQQQHPSQQIQPSLQSLKPVTGSATGDNGDALARLQEACFATNMDGHGTNSGAVATRAAGGPAPAEFDSRLRQPADPYQLSHAQLQPQLASQFVWPGQSPAVDNQLVSRGGDSTGSLVGYNDLMPSIGGYSAPVAGFSTPVNHQLQPPLGVPTPTTGVLGGFQPIDYGGLPLGHHHSHLQPQQMHHHEMMPGAHMQQPTAPVYGHYAGYGAAPGFTAQPTLPFHGALPTSYGAQQNTPAPLHSHHMMYPSSSQHQSHPPS